MTYPNIQTPAARYTDVEYLEIEGYPNYRVGSDGSVWTLKTQNGKGLRDEWKRLSLTKNNFGYVHVCLCHQNIAKSFTVHGLVIRAFHGPNPGEMVCRHLDGNPSNNRPENLAWGTHKDNEDDKRRHGRTVCGERVHGSKLNKNTVLALRKMYSDGFTLDEIANKYGVLMSTVHRAVTGKTWKHIPSIDLSHRKHLGSNRANAKLNEASAAKAKEILRSGLSLKKTAAMFGVSASVMQKIREGKTWRHV